MCMFGNKRNAAFYCVPEKTPTKIMFSDKKRQTIIGGSGWAAINQCFTRENGHVYSPLCVLTYQSIKYYILFLYTGCTDRPS